MVKSKTSHSFKLKNSSEFKSCQDLGEKFVSKSLIVWFSKNSYSFARLGLVVSKKVGNAVVRNKFKRVLRETFRRSVKDRCAYDMVVLVRPKPEGFSPTAGRDIDHDFSKIQAKMRRM